MMELSVWPFSPAEPLLGSAAATFDPSAAGSVLIALPLLGLAVYAWAFWSQPAGRRALYRSSVMALSGQRAALVGLQNVHRPLVSLMFMDVFNGVAGVVLGGALIQRCADPSLCSVGASVWFYTRSLAVLFHLLVALVYVLSLDGAVHAAQLRCLFAVFSVFLAALVLLYVFLFKFGFVLLAVCVFALMALVAAKHLGVGAAAAPGNKARAIVGVAAATVLTVFLPSLVVEAMVLSGALTDAALYLDVLFYSDFTVVLDGVLCYLVLSLSPADDEEPQAPPTGWQPPTYGGQPPATGWQPPATGGQPPATGWQPSTIGGQPPATGWQPPDVGAQPPATGGQPPATAWQLPPPQ